MWTVKGLLAEQNCQIVCSYYSRDILAEQNCQIVCSYYWPKRTAKLCAAITVVTYSEYGNSVWYRKIHCIHWLAFEKYNNHNMTACHENTYALDIST
jgi:hypothetical protein